MVPRHRFGKCPAHAVGQPTAILQRFLPGNDAVPVGRVEAKPARCAAAEVPVRSLQDISDLCTQNRDPKLKACCAALCGW